MDKIYYSDKMFKEDMLQIKKHFKNCGYQSVITPYRGGLTMGTKISHMLGIPLGIIEYQRLDSIAVRPSIKFAIEPIAKDEDGIEIPFIFMNKILLVDDICDTGKSMEKIYKFLKLMNPTIEVDILCIYGNSSSAGHLLKYCPEVKFMYFRDNKNAWITFGTWEDDFDNCKVCKQGETCNRDPENMVHCNFYDKSFPWIHKCEEFSLIDTDTINFLGNRVLE